MCAAKNWEGIEELLVKTFYFKSEILKKLKAAVDSPRKV